MRIRISIRSGCTILTLSGALDEEAAATVRWTLLTRLAAKPWALICDLHAVPFADAEGLTALMPDDHWAPAEPDEHGDQLLRVTPSLKPPGLRLEGEVDASNIVALAAALGIAVAALSEVRLDLAGLESINLRRLMRLAGLDQTPGLRLGGSV